MRVGAELGLGVGRFAGLPFDFLWHLFSAY